jgi:archaetidylinositol phosphate synthase
VVDVFPRLAGYHGPGSLIVPAHLILAEERMMPNIESHTRINDILLGPLERPALKWLAAHMPAWVNSDMLTGVGVLGALVILVGYWLTNIDKGFLWLASLGFVINWFGDSLDGTLARYRQVERPRYGFFVDHTVDAFNEVLIFLGLGLSPYIRFQIASLALIGYLLMSVLVYVRTAVTGEFRISYGRLGPTEVRVIAILANMLIFFFGNPAIGIPWGTITIFELVAALIAGILFLIFIFSTLQEARNLAKHE